MNPRNILTIAILLTCSFAIVFYGGGVGFSTIVLHGLLFFVAATAKRLSINEATSITVILWLASAIVSFSLLHSQRMAAEFFTLLFFINQTIGACIGFSAYWVLGLNQKELSSKKWLVTAFIVLGIGSALLIKHKKQTHIIDQAMQRHLFIHRLAYAVVNEKLAEVNAESIITLGLHNDIYKESEGRIYHGFGGEVIVAESQNDILVTYTDIPSRESCHKMFYYQPVSIVGFNSIHIESNRESELEIHKRKFHFNGKKYCFENAGKTVNIVYSTNRNELKERKKNLQPPK